MRQTLLLLFLFLSTTLLFGQRRDTFSTDPMQFAAELGELVEASSQGELKEVYKLFASRFTAGLYLPEEQARIVETSNAMLAQRLKANPHFQEYLRTLNTIKDDSEADPERFVKWHDVLKSMLDDPDFKSKDFLSLLRFSDPFFERGALRFSETGSVSWLTEGGTGILQMQEGKPVVVFDKVTLLATRKEDTIRIAETTGAFYPEEQTWRGYGGTVTWDRFEDVEASVELDSFSFETTTALYRAKSATLSYPDFFGNKKIKGRFEDKITVGNAATEGSYPRFYSEDAVISIPDIGEGVDYRGGFRLEGTTVYGYGSKKSPAEIVLTDEFNNRRYRGLSELFTIRRGERISGQGVQSSIYFGTDSIYHPSVNVRYDIAERSLALARGTRGNDRNPFYNSLHQMNMGAESVDYYFAADSIVVGRKAVVSSKTKEPVSFESFKYFDPGDYQRWQNISDYNPITRIKLIAEKEGTNILDAEVLAKGLDPKYGIDNIKELLYDLVEEGFVNYDSDQQLVELRDKIFHFAGSAAKQEDYDALRLVSEYRDANGILTLRNNRMLVEGVERIKFSPRQRVIARPYGDQVTIMKNRDLDFNGLLYAGFGVFNGKDFRFEYEPFQITMDSVRYFDLYVPDGTMNDKNQPNAFAIGSRIEYVNGALLIDAPKNKSGLEDIEVFPSINTKDFSYVYYDLPETLDSVYTRDSFYFKLDKFNLDRLDKLRPSDLRFDGELYSHNIFEPIRETLVLDKEDQSLGFSTELTGRGTYLNKGNFSGSVELSNRGFKGNGTLSYLDADVTSEDIIWRPEQFTASAEAFDLPEDRSKEQPQVHGEDVSIDWRPYRDSMYVRTQGSPFDLFKTGDHKLRGLAVLSPGGLKGVGLFEWPLAYIRSDLMNFGSYSVQADTMELKIRALNDEAVALETSNLTGSVDFDKNMGSFKSNVDDVTTVLPYNQYETSLNEFDWDITGEQITFKSASPDQPGLFRSIHPDQDSLIFYGQDAIYDLKSDRLAIGGVEVIRASDAFIYPSDGKVAVSGGAKMGALKNAKIIADTSNQNHIINRAEVRILGKKEYRARGFYEYNIAGREQEIEFEEIVGTRVGKGEFTEKASVTRASGTITDEQNFYIDEKTEFRGDITLDAASPNLQFDGYARLDAPLLTNRTWFTVNFTGNKEDLEIAYEVPLNYEGQQMRTGLFLSKESAVPYPRLLMPLYFRKDRPLLPATGRMKYEEDKDRFVFGDSAKVVNPEILVGNRLYFYNKDGKIEGEGKISLLDGLQYNKATSAGRIETAYRVTGDTTSGGPISDANFDMTVMSGIDLLLTPELLRILTLDFQSSALMAPNIEYVKRPEFYKRATAELFGTDKDAMRAIQNIPSGTLDLPKKLNKFTFLFPRLEMKWDKDYQSFITTGSQIEIASIDGEMFNKLLNGYIEYRMPTGGDDRLYIYFKSPSGYYYYFGYKDGVLEMVSDNAKFNDAVLDMKEKEAIRKMDDGETYELAPADEGRARAFVRRVQAAQKN